MGEIRDAAGGPANPLDGVIINGPAIARIWAALTDGVVTDRDSRVLADQLVERYPGIRDVAAATRRFHSGAARRAASDGARGFIFGGTGLPTEPALHEEAEAVSPGARFLYADPDETHLLLHQIAGLPRTSFTLSTIAEARDVLEAADITGLEPPLHVALMHVATYWPDSYTRKVIAGWARRIPAGSSIALSTAIVAPELLPSDLLRGIADVYPHTAESVRSWFEDAGMEVAGPGVTSVLTWPAAVVGQVPAGDPWEFAGVVAVKPGLAGDCLQAPAAIAAGLAAGPPPGARRPAFFLPADLLALRERAVDRGSERLAVELTARDSVAALVNRGGYQRDRYSDVGSGVRAREGISSSLGHADQRAVDTDCCCFQAGARCALDQHCRFANRIGQP